MARTQSNISLLNLTSQRSVLLKVKLKFLHTAMNDDGYMKSIIIIPSV